MRVSVIVVVLIPIAIMVVACLLERFEARAVRTEPPARTRPALPLTSLSGPTDGSQVTAAYTNDGSRRAPVRTVVGLDVGPAGLRRAS